MKFNFHQIIFCTAALFSTPLAFAADEAITSAKVILSPTQGNQVTGVVNFTQTPKGIKIVADITGLTLGDHGFHVHEFGDCSASDAMSAGGHFNPIHEEHGAPNAPHHHAGDFGNVTADANGKAHFELVDNSIAFTGPTSILGRGLIMHEKADDLHSQPVGNAGGRVACGIVGVSKP